MKRIVASAALSLGLLTAGIASAQSVVPGCLQPDRGVVRVVPGVQACHPAEVAVVLRLRVTPAAQPALPNRPEAGVALAALSTAAPERASAPLGVVATRAAASLGAPATRSLAGIGGELAWRW